jgi:hypothetical protein
MSVSNEVRCVIGRFTDSKKLFTSVDVANDIKKSGIWKRNRVVAAEIREMFSSGDGVFDGYDRAYINVDGDSKSAALYLPCGVNPDDYVERNQKAEVPVSKKVPGVVAPVQAVQTLAKAAFHSSYGPAIKRVPRSMVTQQVDKSDIADVLDTDIIMSKVIKTRERIKIPGPMIRKLGWKPGQPADLSHIKTHNAVTVGVVVSKDYRVSIPRKSVNWGDKPVKVMLTSDNDIIFDKA